MFQFEDADNIIKSRSKTLKHRFSRSVKVINSAQPKKEEAILSQTVDKNNGRQTQMPSNYLQVAQQDSSRDPATGTMNTSRISKLQLLKQVKNAEVFIKQLDSKNEITSHILANEAEMIEEACKLLHEERVAYMGHRFKRWYCMSCGMILGLLISLPSFSVITTLTVAQYNRAGLDS